MKDRLRSAYSKRVIRALVGIAITVVFVWLIAQRVDVASVRSAFGQLNLSIALCGVLALAVGYSVRIWRWYRMLVSIGVQTSYFASARAFMSSMAINSVMPLRAGDALRVVALARETGSSMALVLSTLVIERLFDMSVLLFLLFIVLLGLPANTLPAWILHSAEWLLGVVLVLEVGALAGPRLAMRLAERFVAPLSPKLASVLHRFVDGFVGLAKPQLVLELLGYSIVSWLFEGLLFVTVVGAASAPHPALAGFTTFALATLSTMIPSGPGYVGTFDMFSIIALQVYGIGTDMAAAIAVCIHALLWLSVTVVGGVFLIFTGLNWKSSAKGLEDK